MSFNVKRQSSCTLMHELIAGVDQMHCRSLGPGLRHTKKVSKALGSVLIMHTVPLVHTLTSLVIF